jgi:hypothetical protein
LERGIHPARNTKHAMNHAHAATTLYRVGTCIEFLAAWCPPVKTLLSGYVAKINTLADWHQSQALQAR